MRLRRHHVRRLERGTTLLEALVAFLVLSLGMLTVARVQTQLRLHSDVARQRSEAVRLGQEDMERLRAFSVVEASASAPGARSYAQIASASSTVDGRTRYLVARQVEAVAGANAKTAAVTVAWTDRGGSPHQIALNSIISGTAPAYSGALTIAPSGTPARGAFGRSLLIPLAAKDLGNGSSAFKPVAAGSLALVFSNGSGRVTGRCAKVDPGLATRDLTAPDMAGCAAVSGYLLSGVVRFASTSPADPARARDPPLALEIALALVGGVYPALPQCASEAMMTVSYPAAGGTRTEAVPVGAAPASLGLVEWTESGDRYASYHCVVVPLASGRWSGRSTLVAKGWTVGTGPGEHRVCRYSADLDASGAIDINLEHPSSYSGVDTTLANQNFLVTGGGDTCPGASPIKVEGGRTDVFADLGTAQHQP